MRRHRFKKRLTIAVVVLAIILGFGTAQMVKAETPSSAMTDKQRVALLQFLISQAQRCFAPPVESFPSPVTVAVHLKRDGTLSKPSEVIEPQTGSARAQAAIRAVTRCAPYHIPSQFNAFYGHWKRLQVQFE